MLNLSHKNLEVWKLSVQIVTEIYAFTENFPKREIFGITNQLRKASVSIPSNIAEGCARNSSLERKRFFIIARSSMVEIDTQIQISKKINYPGAESIKDFESKFIILFKMLSSLINKTN